LSTDGSPLAAYPPGEEAGATAIWARLSSLGPVTRGFVTMRSEVWAFVQGERYAALVLADRTVRPGQVLELVDQVLAEAAAASVLAGGDRRFDGATGQRERSAARRFRVPLHPDERESEAPPAQVLEPVTADAEPAAPRSDAAESVTRVEPSSPEATSEDRGSPEAAAPDAAAADATTVDHPLPRGRSGAEVDIIALAREFAGLVSERDDGHV
jgi:hypothetical protein